MAIDLRRLFDQHRVQWRDHGSNCSRGNVNVCCPFCKTDSGFHLGISEEGHGYYCFRNPTHAGGNMPKLFQALGIPGSAYVGEKFVEGTRTEKAAPSNYNAAQSFVPVEQSPEALNYLLTRQFTDPVKVARQFHLTVAPDGRWAGRLIIPLTIGWTGRSMRPHIEPRYLTCASADAFWIYGNSSSVIIHEGALDGMRIASVTTQFTVVAMTGKRLTPALIRTLRDRKPTSIHYLPDDDVTAKEIFNYTRQLKAYFTRAPVKRLHLPAGVKDPCVMPEHEARRWIISSTA